MEGVEDVMTAARKRGLAKGIFNSRTVNHRRGLFAVLGDGVSFGGGQRVCYETFSPQAILTLSALVEARKSCPFSRSPSYFADAKGKSSCHSAGRFSEQYVTHFEWSSMI
jgi:hypothetical protein